VYFIIDYIVINMREDWFHLYMYLLRLNGILEEAKKDIVQKTGWSMATAALASKLANRKFVLRVVKLAEKNIYNIANLVFLVYLIIFGNPNPSPPGTIFKYYKSIEKNLFIGDPRLLNADNEDPKVRLNFLDSKLILETVSSFRISDLDLVNASTAQMVKIINAYLDTEYTKEGNELFDSRFIYLIKAEFKQLKNASDRPFSELFGTRDEHKKTISTGEIISTAIGLCVESSLNTANWDLFEQSIRSLKNFFLWFLLLSTRDGLRQEQHS
jgi:hypothetical protein